MDKAKTKDVSYIEQHEQDATKAGLEWFTDIDNSLSSKELKGRVEASEKSITPKGAGLA